MIKTISKKGRPTAYYRTTWGKKIDGLTRLADGRWKISGPKATKFTEADERSAVGKFYELTQSVGNENLGKAKAHGSFRSALGDALLRSVAAGGNLKTEIGSPAVNDGEFVVTDETLSPAQWAWLRECFFTRRPWLAEQVGIEQIAWMTDLKRPTESMKLADVIRLYAAKPGLSTEEDTRYRRFWDEFSKAVGVATVREITHEHAEQYEKIIAGKDLAPKSVKHRYSGVRTVLAHALKRGRGVEDCRKALDVLAMLEVDGSNPLDPNPIRPADFWAIHKAAETAGDKRFAAMMLFAANCALYPSEAGVVRWSEVDLNRGEFVTRRRKTGVPRVAVLWAETLAALKTLQEDKELIFHTGRAGYNRCLIYRRWVDYCKAANVKGVMFAQIRDAGFTIACRVNLDAARVLAGHRLPGAVDHYVLRAPRFVAAACEAIRAEFYAKPSKVKKPIKQKQKAKPAA